MADRKKIMGLPMPSAMGVDKSNVRFVIHFNLSLSMEGYYQEAGRAGRDRLPAICILMWRWSDVAGGRGLLGSSEPFADDPAAE